MASNSTGRRFASIDKEAGAVASAQGPHQGRGPDRDWGAPFWSPSLPPERRAAANHSWQVRAACPSPMRQADSTLAKELAGVLPSVDSASPYAGDKLRIVQPAEVAAMVERFLGHKSTELGWLDWIFRQKGLARSTGTFPSPEAMTLAGLCDAWLSGDSVAIVRYRGEVPTRLAIVERTSASTIVGKMYFGPVHDTWSSTDQAFYDTGIRRVEAYFVDRRNAERLARLAGHAVAGNSVSIDLDMFRHSTNGVGA